MKKKFLALFLVGALVLSLVGEAFGVQADVVEAATEEGYQYVDTGNVLANPGFENSNSATVSSGSWKLVTEGWKTNYAVGSTYYDWALPSDNTHSGAKAFKVTIKQLRENNNTYTDLRLHDTNTNESSDKPAAGNYENLIANTEYIVSFWVKGTADARIMTKTSTNTTEYTAAKTITEEEWTLVTKTFTPYDADSDGDYEYWWNVYLKGTADGQYAIVDDVQLVTVDQAIANVEKMITELDVKDANADRAIKDIKAWYDVLGDSNISNYDTYTEKVNSLNTMKENGTPLVVPYTSAAYKALKGFGGTEAAKAPVRDGFVFTGWFNSSDVATAAEMNTHVLLDSAGENLTKYNTVYARFVDKGMLTVKAQVGKAVTAESEDANIRFVTTVDNLAYDEVGFKITINDVSKELKSSGVYKKLYEGFLSGGANVLYPTEFYKGSVYFNARTIKKIPKGAFDTEIKVTPYIKTKDGTKVYGESATKTVRLGIEANAAMSAGQ